MGGRVIALFAVVATLAVPSAGAQVVLAPTILHTVELPSDAVTAFTVTCPPGYVAVSGGVSTPAPGATLLAIVPAGIRAFAFRFGNPVTNRAQRVTVSAACRKIRVGTTPGAVLRLRPVTRKPLIVPPGKQRSAALLCPANMAPAGSGVDLAPGRHSAGFTGTQLSVRRITMGLHGLSFTVRNSGGTVRSVAVSGNCITVVRQPGAPRERLHVKVTTFHAPVQPGRQKVGHDCPLEWFSLAAGYALPSPFVAIEGAAAIGRGGKWWVASNADGPAAIVLQLACVRIGVD